MSTNKSNERSDEIRDPTKATDDAMESAREHAKSAIGDIRRNPGEGRG